MIATGRRERWDCGVSRKCYSPKPEEKTIVCPFQEVSREETPRGKKKKRKGHGTRHQGGSEDRKGPFSQLMKAKSCLVQAAASG